VICLDIVALMKKLIVGISGMTKRRHARK